MGSPKEAVRMADGRTMIEHVAATLLRSCASVVVVGGAGPAVEAWHVIDDLRPGLGPLGGIEALLASGIDTQYLVCPCDLPRISTDIVAALTTETDRAATVLQVHGDDAPRPLPARLGAAALPVVRRQLDANRLAVRELMLSLDPLVVAVPETCESALHNVNRPEDV
jgi:molybdopterin-guanine dinucleotide biosynthesis protein A